MEIATNMHATIAKTTASGVDPPPKLIPAGMEPSALELAGGAVGLGLLAVGYRLRKGEWWSD
jgi:hypothetical protein